MAEPAGIDLTPLARALAMLDEALELWHAETTGSRLKPHLRSAVIQAFEFSHELSVRLLRRTLIERAASAPALADLSFNLNPAVGRARAGRRRPR